MIVFVFVCLYSYLSGARTNITLTRDNCCAKWCALPAKSSVILVDGDSGGGSGGVGPHMGGGGPGPPNILPGDKKKTILLKKTAGLARLTSQKYSGYWA